MSEGTNGTANEDAFATTELAERLSGPDGAAFAAELRERLEALQRRVEGAMQAGVPQGQFERYAQLARALASAASVVLMAAKAKSRQGVSGSVL